MTPAEFVAYANIERIKVEVEMMKQDNYQRELQGHTTFNYSPQNFWEKANEISNALNEIYKY